MKGLRQTTYFEKEYFQGNYKDIFETMAFLKPGSECNWYFVIPQEIS